MIRQKLIAALRRAALSCGYTPYYGPQYRIASQVDVLPAAWIEPLKLTAKKGRSECLAQYRVTVKMIAPEERSAEGRERQWNALERDFLEIVHSVAREDFVVSADGAKSACGEASLTNKGEISLEGQIDITVAYLCDAGGHFAGDHLAEAI